MEMIDMMGNVNDLMNMYQQMRSNPGKFFGLPQGVNANDPNTIIQYLMNNGKISQQQMNNAMMQMQRNPTIKQIFGGK